MKRNSLTSCIKKREKLSRNVWTGFIKVKRLLNIETEFVLSLFYDKTIGETVWNIPAKGYKLESQRSSALSIADFDSIKFI